MNVCILGAAGFIGTNLVLSLAGRDNLLLFDRDMSYYSELQKLQPARTSYCVARFADMETCDALVEGQNIVYHLVSTTVPKTSGEGIPQALNDDIVFTARLLEACVRQKVSKVVFLSSGGAVYGKDAVCPVCEDASTDPISAYGLQKLTIEKLLYFYGYMHGLDYRIVRLSNPYGPYQRPNGPVGAVTTFVYRALRGESVQVFGDGSVVRDYIYIDDAIRGILKIANGDGCHKTYNLGCGYGTSLLQIIDTIERVLGIKLVVDHCPGRPVDVPVNYLDISRYEASFGSLAPMPLAEGIQRTAAFIRQSIGL